MTNQPSSVTSSPPKIHPKPRICGRFPMTQFVHKTHDPPAVFFPGVSKSPQLSHVSAFLNQTKHQRKIRVHFPKSSGKFPKNLPLPTVNWSCLPCPHFFWRGQFHSLRQDEVLLMKGCQLQASELGILAALNRASVLDPLRFPAQSWWVWWEENCYPTYVY